MATPTAESTRSASATAARELQIDRARRVAVLDGQALALGGRAFDLLAAMAAQPGRVFTPAELIEKAWPGRVVEDSNLRVQIAALRQRLGSTSIVNVAGRGYAFATPMLGPHPPPRRINPLPWAMSPLLGRDEDLAALEDLVAQNRLVTVLGSGGIGKTSLALALAERLRESFGDGLWWVELASLSTSAQVAAALVQAAELQPGAMPGEEAAAGHRLGLALAGREGLLLLDNAEHLVMPLAALLQTLLAAAPSLRVLVTSQQRLNLAAERAYRLAPLAPAPALQLLLQRAQAVDQRFTFRSDQLESAARLCRQLDGIPLALEMAGARLPLLGLEALQSRMGERLRLLGAEGGLVPLRQRTLQTALEWSHAMLCPDEQAVLRRLSVFAAPFRLEAAQRVGADEGLCEISVLRAVASLVDKSLLQAQVLPGSDALRRYRLLEATRLFAARALADSGERPATETRHVQAMAALAERAQAAYWVSSDVDWMAEWSPDHEDFVLAFDRACAAGDADSAAMLGEALHATANLNGYYGSVQDRVGPALLLLPLAGPWTRARLWNRTPAREVPGLARKEAMSRRLQAWRLVGEPMGLARALAHWAGELEAAGDSAAADAALAELRGLEQADWPPRQRVMGVALARLNICTRRADAAGLRQAMHAWLGLAQAGGLRRVSAQAHHNLAQADMLEGDPDRALQTLRVAAAEYRALGCSIDVAHNLGSQASALLAGGNAAAARDAVEQALMLTDDPLATLQFADALGPLAWNFGRVQEAAVSLGAATSLRARLGTLQRAWEARREEVLHAALERALDAPALAALLAQGAAMGAAGLRHAALAWLRAAR